MEGDHTVATGGVGSGNRIDGRCSIDRVVPHIAVASGHCLCRYRAVVDRQMEGDRAVAPHAVGGSDGGSGGSRKGGVVPFEAIAYCKCFRSCTAMTYGEMQRHHAVASGSIGEEYCGRRSAGRIGLPVPCKAVARTLHIDKGGATVNSQVKRIDIGAVGMSTVVVGVGTSGGIDLSVPVVSVACRHII